MLKAHNTGKTYRTRFGAALGQSTSDIGVFIDNRDYGVAAALIFGLPFVVADCYSDVRRVDSGRYVRKIDPETTEILKKDAV